MTALPTPFLPCEDCLTKVHPDDQRDHDYCPSCASKHLESYLRSRQISSPCRSCSGSGTVLYANTSTWHKGIGGHAITAGVCDLCWGSGDKFHPWVNLRQLQDEEDKRIAERAVDLLAKSCAAGYNATRNEVYAIIEHLDKLTTSKIKKTNTYLPELARGLANALRRSLGQPEIPIR